MPLPKAIQRSDLSRLREEYPYVYLPCLGRDTCLENWGTTRGQFFALKHSTGNPVWTDRFGFPAIELTSGANTGLTLGGTAATLGSGFGGQWNGMETSVFLYVRSSPGVRRIVSYTTGSGTFALLRNLSATQLRWGGTGNLGTVTSASTFNETLLHVIMGWTGDRAAGSSAAVNAYVVVGNFLTGEVVRAESLAGVTTVGTPQSFTIGETVAGTTNAENADILAYTLSSRGRGLIEATRDIFNPWKFLHPVRSRRGPAAAAPLGGARNYYAQIG